MQTPDDDLIDFDTIRNLQRVEATRPGLLGRLHVSFKTTQRDFIARLPQLLVQADAFETIRIRAHSLKGSAASLGAKRLAAQAAALEAAASGGDLAALRAGAEALEADFDVSLAALERHLFVRR